MVRAERGGATALRSAQNTHQVAQEIAPDSRIVYVDNDPIVLAYARALLTSAPERATAYVAWGRSAAGVARARFRVPDPLLRRDGSQA